MNKEQAIIYLKCSGFSKDQIRAIAEAFINGYILDKIRAEIIEEAKGTMNENRAGGLYKALQIIDKYKAEGSKE